MRTEWTWFPLQQVLRLDRCNLWHGGENVGAVSRRSLQTVAMVDLSIPRFLIHVELSKTQDGVTCQSLPTYSTEYLIKLHNLLFMYIYY